MKHDNSDVSLHARILCHEVGIFNMKQEEQMYRQLGYEARDKDLEETRGMMISQWEKYQRARSELEWAYGYPIKFFESAIWKDEKLWPWKVKEVPNESRVEQAIRRTRERYAEDGSSAV